MEEPRSFDEEPGVINGEDRVRVKDTVGVPWRWICRISIIDNESSDPPGAGGTGVLISHRHVLTAAHVVYKEHLDPKRFDIEVTPALDYDEGAPFGTYAVSAKPKIPKSYDPEAANHLDWDYALITLKDRVGKKKFPKVSALGGDPLCF